MDALARSRDRMLKTFADDDIVLAQATAARMAIAHALVAAPADPVRHLETAHARARAHLAALGAHDPAREVVAFMTSELYTRLTDPRPAPLYGLTNVERYTYTPRKVLRRVLDHALDHLNQIDQWLAWQRDGIVPTPTDGWVPSGVTLPDDRLPLTSADLDAWLWRIDQAARLVQQRVGQLSQAQLDWQPPADGWTLRRVLHHLARCERLYGASLDEALPDEDAQSRYTEACRRLDVVVTETAGRRDDVSVVYAGLYGELRRPAEFIELAVTLEDELFAGAR